MVSDEEKQLYNQAIRDVDACIDRVYAMIKETAEMYHYEPEWVMDRFQERFSRRKRKELSEPCGKSL